MLKIKVVGTICEPAAAGLDRLSEQRESTHKEIETYGVCDFGGGTFDLSIVSLYPKGRKYADGSLYYFDIVGSAEGLNIGGNDFTGILETLFNSKLEKTIKKAPSAGNKRTTKREAEKCKLDLSSEGVNEAVIYYDVDDDTVEIRVSRDEFEKAIASKVKEVTDYTRDFFDRHKNHLPDVIIMTGGTSYIPYVQEQLKRALPEFRDRIFLHRPSKAAAYGAARFYNPVPEAVKNTEGGKNKETGEKTTPGIVRKSVPHDIATKVVVGGYTVMETLISAGTELPCDSGEREFISRKAGAKATDYDIYQANKKNPVKSRIKEDYDIIHEAKLEHPNALSNQKTSTRCRVSIDSLGMIRLKAWAKDNSDIRIEHDFKLNGN